MRNGFVQRHAGYEASEPTVNTGAGGGCDFNWDPKTDGRQQDCFPCGPCGPQFGLPRGQLRSYLGFTKDLDPGETAEISLNPRTVFTGMGLTVPSAAMNPGIMLKSVKVGIEEFLNLGPVPLSIFSEVATVRALDMKTAQIGEPITLTVENTTANALTVEGAIVGTSTRC